MWLCSDAASVQRQSANMSYVLYELRRKTMPVLRTNGG